MFNTVHVIFFQFEIQESKLLLYSNNDSIMFLFLICLTPSFPLFNPMNKSIPAIDIRSFPRTQLTDDHFIQFQTRPVAENKNDFIQKPCIGPASLWSEAFQQQRYGLFQRHSPPICMTFIARRDISFWRSSHRSLWTSAGFDYVYCNCLINWIDYSDF